MTARQTNPLRKLFDAVAADLRDTIDREVRFDPESRFVHLMRSRCGMTLRIYPSSGVRCWIWSTLADREIFHKPSASSQAASAR
jgi:hypothetical protein